MSKENQTIKDRIIEFCKGGKIIPEICNYLDAPLNTVKKNLVDLRRSGNLEMHASKRLSRGAAPCVFVTAGYEIDQEHQAFIRDGEHALVETIIYPRKDSALIKEIKFENDFISEMKNQESFKYPPTVSLDFVRQAHNPFGI